MHGHLRQQFAEAPLRAQRLEERRLLQVRQDARRDAAAEIDATCRQDFQGQVAGLCAQDLDEQIQHRAGQRTRARRILRSVEDHGRGVVAVGQLLGQPGGLFSVLDRLEVVVEQRDAQAARAHALEADVRVALLIEVAQKPDLQLADRAEGRVAAF